MILSLYVKISYTLKVQWRLPSHFDLKKLRIVYEQAEKLKSREMKDG